MRLRRLPSWLLTAALILGGGALAYGAQRTVVTGIVQHVIVDMCSGCGGAGSIGQTTMANSSPVTMASDQSSIHVTCDGGTCSGSGLPAGQATMANSGPVVIASNQSAVPVSGTFWQVTQPVSGPLTDAQLRASAVPVSGTFFQATQPVSGPLTDTQLRASAVPVTANAGTNLNTSLLSLESTQALVKAKTDNLDVALSTRLKPADTLTGVTTVATVSTVTAVTSITNPISTKTAITGNTPIAASVGVASATALALNASRKGATFTNTSSTATISCTPAATAVLNSGITLQPSSIWNMDEYTFTTAAIACIASAAATNLSIQEFQ